MAIIERVAHGLSLGVATKRGSTVHCVLRVGQLHLKVSDAGKTITIDKITDMYVCDKRIYRLAIISIIYS